MAEIVVRRMEASWQDRKRSYGIFIDGTQAAKVANGKEVRIPLLPGKHVVVLKIDWCKSNTVDVELRPDEVKTLECGPNAKPLLALLYITMFRHRYLWLCLANNSVGAAPKVAPSKM